MKMQSHRLLMGLGLAAALCLPTHAQETAPTADVEQTPAAEQQTTQQQPAQQQPTQEREPVAPRTGQQQQQQQQVSVLRASTIDGMEVRNSRGEDLGSVEDLMIDMQSGEVRYAALSFGGFLGIGDKLFAIPWDLLRVQQQGDDRWIVFDITKERLEAAPGFNQDNWPNMADPKWHNEVDRYYQAERNNTLRR